MTCMSTSHIKMKLANLVHIEVTWHNVKQALRKSIQKMLSEKQEKTYNTVAECHCKKRKSMEKKLLLSESEE